MSRLSVRFAAIRGIIASGRENSALHERACLRFLEVLGSLWVLESQTTQRRQVLRYLQEAIVSRYVSAGASFACRCEVDNLSFWGAKQNGSAGYLSNGQA